MVVSFDPVFLFRKIIYYKFNETHFKFHIIMLEGMWYCKIL